MFRHVINSRILNISKSCRPYSKYPNIPTSLRSNNVLLKSRTLANPVNFQPWRQQHHETEVKSIKMKNGDNGVGNLKVEVVEPVTLKEKFKRAVKEYGTTVIIFHIGISLISLGTCYLIISSGVDVTAVLEYVGLQKEKNNAVATTAGTFALAYAVHKVFAPVRITITLASVPFIVRYLRKIGYLKKK